MADVLTPHQRSKCMSRVRSKHTRPELELRKALWHRGLRYRLHANIPGKPDIVFPQSRLAIFVDGCFWHRCPLHGTRPKTNEKFWRNKLNSNVRRAHEVERLLAESGWHVIRVWQHELRQTDLLVRRIASAVSAPRRTTHIKGKSPQLRSINGQ